MREAGPTTIAPYLHEEAPESRAKQVLARMRDKGVSGRKALIEALGVAVALRTLDGIPRDREYWTVQLAKRVHRLGSAFRIMHGIKVAWQWHPEPRGQVLRHLGRMVEVALDKGFGEADFKAVAGLAQG